MQGQEERIIFISTTLSKPESLPPPLPDVTAIEQQQLLQPQHNQRSSGSWALVGGVSDVGFWRNPKRFNVAITRAKALLVVVGSPRVLAADDNWRQLLRHCIARWVPQCQVNISQSLHTRMLWRNTWWS
jgi:putative helicase MOV10L1